MNVKVLSLGCASQMSQPTIQITIYVVITCLPHSLPFRAISQPTARFHLHIPLPSPYPKTGAMSQHAPEISSYLNATYIEQLTNIYTFSKSNSVEKIFKSIQLFVTMSTMPRCTPLILNTQSYGCLQTLPRCETKVSSSHTHHHVLR